MQPSDNQAEPTPDPQNATAASDGTGEQNDAKSEGDSGRVAELEAEAARLKDQLMRALAEQENMRKRVEREREDTAKYAVSKFAKDLLSAADNMRRAVESVPGGEKQEGPLGTLMTGILATERELLGAFDRNGVKRLDPLGERFDHNFHQAIFETENTGQAGRHGRPGASGRLYAERTRAARSDGCRRQGRGRQGSGAHARGHHGVRPGLGSDAAPVVASRC